MDTPIIYGLLPLVLISCFQAHEDSGVLAPVSKTLKIIDVAFLDPDKRIKADGSVYRGGLKGHLQITFESNDSEHQTSFNINAGWNVRHSKSGMSIASNHRFKGELRNNTFEVLVPLNANLAPGSYLLTIRLDEELRGEVVGYNHEVIIQE